MGSFFSGMISSLSTSLVAIIIFSGAVLYILSYVVYQRYIHPLADYPGPSFASLTDLWQVIEFLSLKQPYNLTKLHEQYGQFVRYGPDKLSTTAEDAIPLLYQKGGRTFSKTEFYDAYGAAHPNVFGMRDESASVPLWRAILMLSTDICSSYTRFGGTTWLIASQYRTSRKWNTSWMTTLRY